MTNFFNDLDDNERKSIKELSCKMVKQINERIKAEKKHELLLH